MARKFLALLLLLMPVLVNAQDLALFKLNQFGQYTAENGDDYIVIPFEGKTSHQIYQELASNVSSLFNNPSKVMTGVEDASIKIRAFSDDLIRIKILGLAQSLGGYYQLEFKIKDGRVRVSAPMIEETMWIDGPTARTFTKEVKGYFKNGELKEKKAQDYKIVVAKMNAIVNSILGSTKSEEDDNW